MNPLYYEIYNAKLYCNFKHTKFAFITHVIFYPKIYKCLSSKNIHLFKSNDIEP